MASVSASSASSASSQDDTNDFIAVNQFRVDPPGAIGDRGFIVPDIVLFVNGIPLVVIEAKSPAVTDPLATAIDQLRRYANRRVPEQNEGAERLFWTNHLLVPTSYYEARVGSVSARPDDYLPWRDVRPATIEQVRGELGKTPGSSWCSRRSSRPGCCARRICSTHCGPSPSS